MANARTETLIPDATANAKASGLPCAANIAVHLDGVRKRFGESTALHQLWLTIHEGEFVTLLGPSGCGKSTLLNLVAGAIEADIGEIFVDGRRVAEMPPHLREIGFVSQDPGLFAQLSVANNIGHDLRMRGVAEDEIATRVADVLMLVKLEGFGERKPHELSGGQQQRVALGRALVGRPKVLLLDEPFSVLDKDLRRTMLIELKNIQRTLGVTTLLVTHDQSEALSISDRVAIMCAGHVRQFDTPDAVYRHPQDPFVAGFIGDVNVLPGRYLSRNELATLDLGNSLLRVPAERVHAEVGARLDVYVRSENIHLSTLGSHSLFSATVIAHVFQGDHVDIYLDVPALGQKHIVVRQPGLDALTAWPAGAVAGLTFDCKGVCAFTANIPPSL